jgi:hypothetical protein
MKRLAPILAAALLALLPVSAARATVLEAFDVQFRAAPPPGAPPGALGPPTFQAGAHPYAMTTSFEVQTTEVEPGLLLPAEALKDSRFDQVAGLAGSPAATPRCALVDFLTLEFVEIPGEGSVKEPVCAESTVLGVAEAEVGNGGAVASASSPVYSLPAPPGVAARLGFVFLETPVTVEVGLDESPPYRIVARTSDTSQLLEVNGFRLTLWGVPADHRHDTLRGHCLRPAAGEPTGGTCEAGVPEKPFLTLPRACRGPLATTWSASSWQRPDHFDAGEVLTHDEAGPRGFGFCGKLGFAPEITAKPTTLAASAGSGLDFSLDVEDEGLVNPKAEAVASDIEKTVVTLPPGMTINPSQAEGLEVCSEEQLAAETASSAPGAGCPAASKIGTIEVETQLLPEYLLKGQLYVAKPYENEAGDSLIAVYVVIQNPELGIKVVQPLRVEPDPQTGQLVTYSEDMPQLPFSHFRLRFREGARSPLISPPGCGSFEAKAVLYPYSGGAPVTSTSSFQIVSGPNNGPCPSGQAPFNPGFEAGTLNNQAGSYSPFVMRLTRADGEQDMGRFSFVLPPGVVPKLAGIPYCSEAAIAQAMSRQGPHGGTEEKSDPSCPAASEIGRTLAGAGVGNQLTYVAGKLYLAGPWHGDPISAVSITPAVAGPFDAGTVVVREALRLNPVTHVGEVDGSASDPIPHILKGIPLNLRDLRVYADRPEFTLNSTSCEPFAASSTIWGDGTALEPLGETPVTLSSRYQAAGCASLGFKPKLAINLRGGTRRGAHPALKAVVTPRPGDANFAGAVVTLPHSAFLDQAHIRTICTRVQFAAGGGNGERCPKGAVYGYARAWTPLLDEPLTGPVFLRSSNHNLPDLVVALHGLVDIDLDARIDSVHGGIRSTFAGVPDAPVSRFILEMQGAKKGLIVNSADLCAGKHRADARLSAQNGRVDSTKPLVRAVKCKRAHRKRHRAHHRRGGRR